MDYTTAEGIIAEHRRNCGKYKGVISKVDPCSKRLQNKTWLRYDNDTGAYRLELFGNSILEFQKDSFMVNDCGWFSRTTHLRLNEYMPDGFRIYTRKLMYLPGIRTLGFIKTPAGAYPYNMPMTFTYDGETMGNGYSRHASVAISNLTHYVDENLDRLLHHRQFDFTASNLVMYDPDIADLPWTSRHLAVCVVENVQLSYLAQAAVEYVANTDEYDGLYIDDIIRVLLSSGHDAFKRTVTKSDLGRSMEHTIKHRMPLSPIPARWIRKTLRPLLLDYIVDKLGFERAEWNRRGN